jgi:hypothetical protein
MDGFAISIIFTLLGYAHLTPFGSIGIENIYLMIFMNGLLASGGVWLTHTAQEAFERAFTNK